MAEWCVVWVSMVVAVAVVVAVVVVVPAGWGRWDGGESRKSGGKECV